ncbi:hypothetical protein LJB90_02535 [Eubacteriales bacterium OttesenSCG-928-G02]|nr:hypothetical protein [Eubacteriales bacterium OttesenSCG-928-G02]
MASKIHAMSNAYLAMTEWHKFDEHELEYYLQFQNPLEVVADELCDRNIDIGDVDDSMEYLYGHSDKLFEAYPLMCDIKESSEQTTEKPKRSLEEKLKEAKEKADAHNASVSGDKKSKEPEIS